MVYISAFMCHCTLIEVSYRKDAGMRTHSIKHVDATMPSSNQSCCLDAIKEEH